MGWSPLAALPALALAACAPGLSVAERGAAKSLTDGLMAAYQAIRMGDRLLSFETPFVSSTTDLELAAAAEARARAELQACGSVARDGANVTVELGPWPGCSLADGSQVAGTLVAMAVSHGSSYADMNLVFGRVLAGERTLDGTLTFSPLAPRWMVFNQLYADDVQVVLPGQIRGRSGTLTVDTGLAVLRPTAGVDGGMVVYSGFLYAVEWVDGDCYPRSGRLEIEAPTKVVVTFSGRTPSTGRAEATGEQGRMEIDLPTTRNCPPG